MRICSNSRFGVQKLIFFQTLNLHFQKAWKCEILLAHALSWAVCKIFRPCRGPLAARSRPFHMVRSTLTIWKFSDQPEAQFSGSAVQMCFVNTCAPFWCSGRVQMELGKNQPIWFSPFFISTSEFCKLVDNSCWASRHFGRFFGCVFGQFQEIEFLIF